MLLFALLWGLWAQPPNLRVCSSQRATGCCYPPTGRGRGLSLLTQGSAAPMGGPGCCDTPCVGGSLLSPLARRSTAHKGLLGCCYLPSDRSHCLSPLASGFAVPKDEDGVLLTSLW